MGYTALTAFLLPRDATPEEWAKHLAQRWHGMPIEELEAELLPMLQRMQRACDELKATGRLHVLEG